MHILIWIQTEVWSKDFWLERPMKTNALPLNTVGTEILIDANSHKILTIRISRFVSTVIQDDRLKWYVDNYKIMYLLFRIVYWQIYLHMTCLFLWLCIFNIVHKNPNIPLRNLWHLYDLFSKLLRPYEYTDMKLLCTFCLTNGRPISVVSSPITDISSIISRITKITLKVI